MKHRRNRSTAHEGTFNFRQDNIEAPNNDDSALRANRNNKNKTTMSLAFEPVQTERAKPMRRTRMTKLLCNPQESVPARSGNASKFIANSNVSMQKLSELDNKTKYATMKTMSNIFS